MTEALAQTVLQMGMTNYQPLWSYAVCIFPLRTLYRCYARQLRVLYVGSIRTMWRRFSYAMHRKA